jgi:two-component system response regulator HydG
MTVDAHKPVILVVDDKKNMLRLMSKVLGKEAQVLTADRGAKGLALLGQHSVDVMLCDLRMPDMDGIDVLKECKKRSPTTQFILMTAYASVDTAVEALRLGAADYLTKPFEPEEARAVALRAMGRSPSASCSTNDQVLPGVISCSSSMAELGVLVKQVAASDATVLLLGETGTGKERIARAVHRLSPRASQRFVAVNCAAIPADLLESELFGHSKGAFTGAGRDSKGLFEEANGGALFLDEIGEMRPSLQAKLTRALEEKAIRRLGESAERSVDVRVIAATHRNIEAMILEGQFREDLWYRLNVATVRIPPLRDRKGDVELLATYFLREFAPESKRIVGFSDAALGALEQYRWAGNVRQLRAAIERACVVCTGERIEIGNLPPEIVGVEHADSLGDLAKLTWAKAQERGREDLSRRYLEGVLSRHEGDVSEAAEQAGVERESFYRLMRRYGVELETKSQKRKKP